ncbi:PilZ domain-containing protein [Alteromonas oceanisediminis]|uniref:PilZ domain-containing protein n=1 Tax=Alteromonas oceanisediminis TaxID=2836180 RepID=UPI001BD91D9A|nr:PilZ domain-containing protein [Alteromonas oceanisediminis]MBT0587821.1 PilZ domain-containing protein [Alteromonas oceanisediminis]
MQKSNGEGVGQVSDKPIGAGQISDEALLIQKYKPLIDKLIPLQQENRLLEGLNKFSDKIPSRVRNIIKQEVIRLTSLTDASADNSEFAKFPVLKFKHFGIPMRLDKVGKEILDRETKRFLDRYTVGVFESVMNSEHYQSKVRQEQQEKIVKAFSVESQSFKDIDFADDLAIKPNFTVFCAEFDKGRNCPLAALSSSGMIVETKRAPIVEGEHDTLSFTFPDIAGLTSKGTQIAFEMGESRFNRALSVFETQFTLAKGTPRKLVERLSNYVEKMVNQVPLQRDLEIERVMQDLERDRIFSFSPWIPIFVAGDAQKFTPRFQLITPTNAEYNEAFVPARDLPGSAIFQRLMSELIEHQETFLLKGIFTRGEQSFNVAITYRDLCKTNSVKQFIELAAQSGSFKVLQCRLRSVSAAHKALAMDIHDMIANDYPELSSVKHILFCKDVTNWIGDLVVAAPEPFKPFPKSIIDDASEWPLTAVMEQASDRRKEARYVMDSESSIKTGLFTQAPAKLVDLSASGLKLIMSQPQEFEPSQTVKVSIKDLKVSNEVYEVAGYNSSSGILRLKLPNENKASNRSRLKRLFSHNADYFSQRDLSRKQRNFHRFLWELCIRNLPCASVLISNNRFTIDRLKTVYHAENDRDLEPFSVLANEVPLHGFFADKEATKPKSTTLDNMLKHDQRDVHVIHVVKNKDQSIIYVKEHDFLYGKTRLQISAHVAQQNVKACVTHLCAIRCNTAETPLTSKRFAQLSKIDIDMYEKLKIMQSGYTHVLYLSNVADFHNILLKFGIAPAPQASTPLDTSSIAADNT